jgi:hypothetical protein
LAIDEVRKGNDPKHIVRDPAKNEMVYLGLRQGEEDELVAR